MSNEAVSLKNKQKHILVQVHKALIKKQAENLISRAKSSLLTNIVCTKNLILAEKLKKERDEIEMLKQKLESQNRELLSK